MMDRVGIMFFIPQLRYSWARLDPIDEIQTEHRPFRVCLQFCLHSAYVLSTWLYSVGYNVPSWFQLCSFQYVPSVFWRQGGSRALQPLQLI